MLTTLIAFLIVIGVLVFVHELGHLIAAKSVDIAVPRFSIGFGPRVTGFRWGETEYVISALPLGGYVRMAGMEDTAALEGGEELAQEPSDRDFDAKPLWARIWVVSAGVLMNFLFAIVVVTGVALVYGESINPTTRVAIARQDSLPGAAAPLGMIPTGAELESINQVPVENWNDVLELFADAGPGPLTLGFSDGQTVTLDLPQEERVRVSVLQRIQPFAEPLIGGVNTGSPADVAGIEEGDRVIEADGRPIRSWTEFVDVIRAHPGEEVALVVQRGGEEIPITVTPEPVQEQLPEGERLEIGRLGVSQQLELDHRRVGLGEALRQGWETTWGTSTAIVRLVGDLFTGDASPRSLGGPLTIGQISGETARAGLEVMLQWMALLSVNLAVLNLLPIPVLDGGQLLFLFVEAVRGRPLSVEQRLRLSHVGLIIVVGIMVWAITNDFLRLFGI
ncbi:MAG TPA: RIP metalloprotease RseP [Longimicrobiaceae bacterium]